MNNCRIAKNTTTKCKEDSHEVVRELQTWLAMQPSITVLLKCL